jgi:hypothetical protein
VTGSTPEAPRDSRGASSWAQRVNEGTADWLAAVSRIGAVVAFVAADGAAIGALWSHGDRETSWTWTTVVLALTTFALWWLGFRYLANPEWKADPHDDAD